MVKHWEVRLLVSQLPVFLKNGLLFTYFCVQLGEHNCENVMEPEFFEKFPFPQFSPILWYKRLYCLKEINFRGC